MAYDEQAALRNYALGVLRDPQATDHDRGCARKRLTQRWDATRLTVQELELVTALLERGLDDRGAALEAYSKGHSGLGVPVDDDPATERPQATLPNSHLGCTAPVEDTKKVTRVDPKPVTNAPTVPTPPSDALQGFLKKYVKPEGR